MLVPPISATVRKSFLLEDWTSHEWTQPAPDLSLFDGGLLGNDLAR